LNDLIELKKKRCISILQQLSYVPNPDKLEYKIEKVLKYKTVNGKKLGLVKWKGYDSKLNSWEPISSLKNI
jgi:hypothetical protein